MKNRLLISLALASAACLPSLAAIPDGWTIEPTDGSSVTEIKTFVVKKNNGRFDAYVNRTVKINDKDYPVTQKVSGTYDDVNTITLTDDAITEPGTYNIVIPAGTFDYDYNVWTDEGESNPEMSFTLKIDGAGPGPDEFQPIENEYYTIEPEQGKVGKIQVLTVEYQRSGMFPEGYGSNKPVLVNEKTGETVATFTVEEGGGMYDVNLTLPEAYTVPGTYLVKIPDNAISDYNDSDWPAANFRYVIDESISPEDPKETVTATPETGSSVSTLESVMLLFPNMSEVYANGPEKDNVTVKKNGEATDIKGAFSFDSATMDADQLKLTFTPAITEAGDYEIYVPARALSLYASTFDSRYSYEFTLNYTVKGALAEGTKITVAPLTYKVVSGTEHTLSVTFPADEKEYSGVTEVPATVEYDGDTWTVVEIGKLAFSEVKGISAIKVPETVISIGEGAFWESSLSEITIPASVTSIGESAFENCSLKEIVIPDNVTTLGSDAFSTCLALESIKLNNVITEIPGNLASGCTALTKIDIPQCVTRIGEFAFSECAALADVTLPDNLTQIDRFAFAYTQALQKLPLPETVTTLGHGVFYQSGLTEAALPENITVIPDGTFQCCASLKEFVVSDNVTDIEKEAFFWCFDLEKITLGAKVATIGSDCFKSDKKLMTVTSFNPVPPVGAKFEDDVYASATLYVPDGAKDAYAAADGWKEFSKIEIVGTGVGSVSADNGLSVTAVAGGLNVSADSAVEVFDAAGRRVYAGAPGVIELPQGLYIVVSGAKAVKVVL